WWASQSATTRATTTRRRLVDHLLACASIRSALVGAAHANAALDHALRFGFVDLIEQAKKVIQERVHASSDEMKTHAFEFTLPSQVIVEIDNLVDGAPTAGAAVRELAALGRLCEVPIEDVRRNAEAQL